MAIVQISKIQHRAGNLVDLPQLDEAEFGWASDEKRLFIGKTTPNENIEVLTGYSNISYSQLEGSVGNLNINPLTAEDGQVLVYDGTNWVNRGGNVSGLINLGDVTDVKISGGAIGYVLETDGLGNLSWTPKSTIIAYISDVTQDDPGVVTTEQDNFFVQGAGITITDVVGMTELNGNTFYVDVLTSNTFALYDDSTLTTPTDTSLFTAYVSGGRIVSVVGGSSGAAAQGSNTSIQFNNSGILGGDADFTFNSSTKVMTLVGNATVGNLTTTGVASATRFISNIATGTAPFVVTSTTQVANLSVATAGTATTAGTVTTAAQPNITSVGTLTSLGVSGNITAANITANTGVFTGNGSGLSAIAGANVTGTVANATFATSAGTVTTAAQPNITSVGTLSSLSVTGTVTAGNVYANSGTIGAGNLLTTVLTAGANTTAGTITGNWTLSTGSRLQATYADLAEYYTADQPYEPGTVLEFGGEFEVTIAEDETNRVAGVVSTNPAYIMNSTCPGQAVAIALQGRVPCKVRGNIRKGDMLVSGGNGFARPTTSPRIGTIIGKALEDYSGTGGIIEVAVGRL